MEKMENTRTMAERWNLTERRIQTLRYFGFTSKNLAGTLLDGGILVSPNAAPWGSFRLRDSAVIARGAENNSLRFFL